jgi:hypothetical protein
MADEYQSKHTKILASAREKLVEERRYVASALADGQVENMKDRFNAIQATIEAIDRALQDERHIANEGSRFAMPVFGSGEDFLTLHAIMHGLKGVLDQLGDRTDPAKAVVLFRPSFGRGGSPQFGEFDCIVGTTQCVYLIETKHADSSEISQPQLLPGRTVMGAVVTLDAGQGKRHKVFREYLEESWRSPPRNRRDWPEFAKRMQPRLQKHELDPPDAETRLAKNLIDTMQFLDHCGHKIVDVLLFCRLSGSPELSLSCEGFQVVTYECPAVAPDSRFVRL